MVRPKPFEIQPAALALSYLAHFVGLAANRRLLQQMKKAGFGELRESHGYLIQHLLAGPRSVGELAALLGVSQQAVSKTVAELVAAGYLESKTGEDARVRLVQLSHRGEQSVLTARRLRHRLERQLERKLGASRFGQTRSALAELLELLGGVEAVQARRVKGPDTE